MAASLQITTTKHNSWSAKNPFDLLENISFHFGFFVFLFFCRFYFLTYCVIVFVCCFIYYRRQQQQQHAVSATANCAHVVLSPGQYEYTQYSMWKVAQGFGHSCYCLFAIFLCSLIFNKYKLATKTLLLKQLECLLFPIDAGVYSFLSPDLSLVFQWNLRGLWHLALTLAHITLTKDWLNCKCHLLILESSIQQRHKTANNKHFFVTIWYIYLIHCTFGDFMHTAIYYIYSHTSSTSKVNISNFSQLQLGVAKICCDISHSHKPSLLFYVKNYGPIFVTTKHYAPFDWTISAFPLFFNR